MICTSTQKLGIILEQNYILYQFATTYWNNCYKHQYFLKFKMVEITVKPLKYDLIEAIGFKFGQIC